ncbi:GTP pyrophosphokinase [Protaetiibacter mangrovi]|uniref:GTP pyrophosphokinase family protein n=1 Tax=Protaetiibacter mangrovi TaxID=2970926 RepID=A0ABT1ZCZ7_9MICO|nr:GTP pyrophosphokinase family protein [Protaetiibacter mangrovi]MCS0498588.1 GTP pyrophosphokinase family protein [Protaetiibacter mangrovi]
MTDILPTTGTPTSADLAVYRGLFQSMTGYDATTAGADGEVPLQVIKNLQKRVAAFHLSYKFAIDELTTKIEILQEEFEHTHDYSPIEHVRTRLKSMDSIIEKVQRTGTPPDVDSVRARIRDIAGVRITCAFVADAYWVADMLMAQTDLEVLEIKDYIAHPKANGYQSLHLIVTVPVFLSDRTELVPVEIQLRTIAMDFWASLEHKIYYKYDREVPAQLVAELTAAADAARALDAKMARLREQVRALPE